MVQCPRFFLVLRKSDTAPRFKKKVVVDPFHNHNLKKNPLFKKKPKKNQKKEWEEENETKWLEELLDKYYQDRRKS